MLFKKDKIRSGLLAPEVDGEAKFVDSIGVGFFCNDSPRFVCAKWFEGVSQAQIET